MQRRVMQAIMSVTSVVVLLFAVPLGFVVGRLLSDRAILALEHRADLAARSIDLTSPTDEPDPTEFPSGPEHFALYSPSGELRIGAGPGHLEAVMRKAQTGNTTTRRIAGQFVTAVPIVAGESVLGFVRAARSDADLTATTRRAIALLAVGVLAVLAVGWGLARRLAHRIAGATGALRDAAISLGEGDFTVRVPPVGIGELDDIARALSSTAAELDALVAREQSFSADASHQLKTPIAGMRTALEAELAFPRAQREAIVRESLADLARLEQTLADLLALARSKRDSSTTIIDPQHIASSARDHWAGAFARTGRPLTLIATAAPAQAYGQTALLRQAIDALLDNALTHGAGPTMIEVRRDLTTETLTIAIGDEGPGFPADDTEDHGSHAAGVDPTIGRTGLGLPLTRRLVQAQGGRLVTARHRPHPVIHIVLNTPAMTQHAAHETELRGV